jgi:hypothetical protein
VSSPEVAPDRDLEGQRGRGGPSDCRRQARAGHELTEVDLDKVRNICRCGTYSRIRAAIKAVAENM